MVSIRFGTEGWRGIIAEDFTFENVRACAQGVADYMKGADLARRGVVIGYDTRFASENFAAAVAEVMAANNLAVLLSDKPIPVPTLCYQVVTSKAGGGVMITASHNPAQWNGFKFKADYGGSAPPEVMTDIEQRLPDILQRGPVKRCPLPEALRQGLVRYFDVFPSYSQALSRLVDLERLREAGLKIAVDSMYGAGAGYFRRLLAGGRTQVREIKGERNPAFPGISPEPIAQHLRQLSSLVLEEKAQVGLATDGDADRLGLLDEKGQFINQLQVYALLALYLLEVRGERGAVIKTITSTQMLYRLGELYQVPVFETPVGFKYVAPKMIEEKALVGGEESGGYGFRGHIPDRDGILAGLYFLDLMVCLGKKPSDLVEDLYRRVGPHYYDRLDLAFPGGERERIQERLSQAHPARINGTEVVGIDTWDGYRYRLNDGSWLLIRFSGTEPILRIYAETSSTERVEKLLAEGRKLVGL